jgi:RHS repeat-associated protein
LNEEDGSGTLLRTRLGGLAVSEGSTAASGTWAYYLTDVIGSTRGLWDQDGERIGKYEYTPFGGKYADSGSEVARKYTGHDWDSSARLYHTAYRYYSPDANRWLTRDPLGMVDGPNVYAYVRNNPVAYSDPLGLAACHYYIVEHTMICTRTAYNEQTQENETFHYASNQFASGYYKSSDPGSKKYLNNPKYAEHFQKGPIPYNRTYLVTPHRRDDNSRRELVEQGSVYPRTGDFQIHRGNRDGSGGLGCIQSRARTGGLDAQGVLDELYEFWSHDAVNTVTVHSDFYDNFYGTIYDLDHPMFDGLW